MEVHARTLLLASLLGSIAFAAYSGSAVQPQFIDDDEAALRKAGVKVDGDELLAYLRRQSGADDDLAGIDQLVPDLGAPKQATRVGAADKLIALGPVALPRLRKAAKESEDREIVRSAKRCVDRITKGWDYEQRPSTIRRSRFRLVFRGTCDPPEGFAIAPGEAWGRRRRCNDYNSETFRRNPAGANPVR